jgi:GNAT superfamily N-acetyltransferase
MKIQPLITPDEIKQAHETIQFLRPALRDVDLFAQNVQKQFNEGYRFIGIEHEGKIVACSGFRILNTLAWGKIVYIDDLVTHEAHRGKGYALSLLDYIQKFARENGCGEIHLDSGYMRNTAHKVYLNYGFILATHHFSLKVN